MKLKSLAALFLSSIFGIAAAQQQPAAPAQTQSAPAPQNPNATVIFSRSDEEAAPQSAANPASPQSVTSVVTDAERAAVTFPSCDLDLHLAPRDHSLSARAQ